MIWQDAVVSIASIVFIYAMIPQIIYGFKKKRGLITYQFSILNILAMIALSIAYFSLDMLFSTIASVIITSLWTTLLIQRIIYPD